MRFSTLVRQARSRCELGARRPISCSPSATAASRWRARSANKPSRPKVSFRRRTLPAGATAEVWACTPRVSPRTWPVLACAAAPRAKRASSCALLGAERRRVFLGREHEPARERVVPAQVHGCAHERPGQRGRADEGQERWHAHRIEQGAGCPGKQETEHLRKSAAGAGLERRAPAEREGDDAARDTAEKRR